MSEFDDQLRQFLAAATEGDNHALGELVRRTQPMVWRLCTALGTRGEEADLVQETYLRAMGSLVTYRGEAPVLAWLLTVARNVCADDVRRRQRRRRLMDRLVSEAREHHAPAHEMIDDIVDQLDDDRREAFMLTQYVGLSYEEAAAVLDCPIGTVRSRVSRARRDLAEIVTRSDIA